MALLTLRVVMVLQARKVHVEIKDHLDHRDHQDLQDCLARMEDKAHQET